MGKQTKVQRTVNEKFNISHLSNSTKTNAVSQPIPEDYIPFEDDDNPNQEEESDEEMDHDSLTHIPAPVTEPESDGPAEEEGNQKERAMKITNQINM